jgi:hypothetical protein
VRRMNEALKNIVGKWQEITFGGIVRIEFPVVAPALPETVDDNARVRALIVSVRNRLHLDSVRSGF